MADKQMLIRYWEKVRPSNLVLEYENRMFLAGSRSMLFFLVILMRNISKTRYFLQSNNTPIFSVDDILEYTDLFPDELLPPYRKKRNYISSILAQNEILRDSNYNKKAFIRIKRGFYLLNAGAFEGMTNRS